MAELESLSHVGIFTRDQKKAREFYVQKAGLKVRDSQPKFGYLALGTTKGGTDASLDLWQPDPATWGDNYEPSMKLVGTVTGVGFRTSNLDGTLETLRRRGVSVEFSREESGDRYARFTDIDGNVLFLFETRATKARRTGLTTLDFITVVTRDVARSEMFFTRALGMKAEQAGENFFEYRLTPEGTAISPFMPQRDMYENPEDFEADMGHIGENTWIMFQTKDILAAQETLMSRGVRFKRKAEQAPWGGMEAEFFDPDDNVYGIMEPASAARR